MKRILLSVSVICLLAGQASAGLYTLDSATALQFRQLSATGSSGLLNGVFNGATFVYQNPWLPAQEYPATMQGAVGFVGSLSGDLSWMRIGLESSLGAYDGFRVFLANDDQSDWEVRLVTNAVTPDDDDWVPLAAGESTWLELAFSPASLTMIGFDVRLNMDLPNPPSINDTFHVSAVPMPAAVLLGMLGLGVAGLKLRKFV